MQKRKIEFVKKSAGTEKRNREIGSFFSLCAMGALTGARPERAQIAGSGWQAYGEKVFINALSMILKTRLQAAKNEYFFNFGIILFTLMKD